MHRLTFWFYLFVMAPHPTRKKPSRHNNVTHDLPLSFLLSLFPKLFCCSFQKLYKNRHCILCWPLSTQWGIELDDSNSSSDLFILIKHVRELKSDLRNPLSAYYPHCAKIYQTASSPFSRHCVCVLFYFFILVKK